MNERNDSRQISPVRADAGVTTAPMLSAADEIAQLQAEVSRLKALLGQQGATPGDNRQWPTEITYGQQPYSGARLAGITKDRDKVQRTDDFPELPKPTTDQTQLEADFIRWGYCMVADALTNMQCQAQIDRLLDQAAAERAAGVASMSHGGTYIVPGSHRDAAGNNLVRPEVEYERLADIVVA